MNSGHQLRFIFFPRASERKKNDRQRKLEFSHAQPFFSSLSLFVLFSFGSWVRGRETPRPRLATVTTIGSSFLIETEKKTNGSPPPNKCRGFLRWPSRIIGDIAPTTATKTSPSQRVKVEKEEEVVEEEEGKKKKKKNNFNRIVYYRHFGCICVNRKTSSHRVRRGFLRRPGAVAALGQLASSSCLYVTNRFNLLQWRSHRKDDGGAGWRTDKKLERDCVASLVFFVFHRTATAPTPFTPLSSSGNLTATSD